MAQKQHKTAVSSRGRGRPAGDDRMGGRINCRVPDYFIDELKAMCRKRADRPDVAQIVRELLGEALTKASTLTTTRGTDGET